MCSSRDLLRNINLLGNLPVSQKHFCSCIIISLGAHPAIFFTLRNDISIEPIPDKHEAEELEDTIYIKHDRSHKKEKHMKNE